MTEFTGLLVDYQPLASSVGVMAVLEGRQTGILCYLGQASSLSKAQTLGMPNISTLLGLLLSDGKRGSPNTRMKLNSGFHHYFS